MNQRFVLPLLGSLLLHAAAAMAWIAWGGGTDTARAREPWASGPGVVRVVVVPSSPDAALTRAAQARPASRIPRGPTTAGRARPSPSPAPAPTETAPSSPSLDRTTIEAQSAAAALASAREVFAPARSEPAGPAIETDERGPADRQPGPSGPRPQAGNAAPTYPEACRRRREEGTVIVRAWIDAHGRVRRTQIERSSGVVALDESAARAVADWRFEPARDGGAPVEAIANVPIEFALGPP